MTERVLVLAIWVACGPAPATSTIQEVPVHPDPSRACSIELSNPGGQLAIDGVALPDLRVATLRAVLGAPDRIEHTQKVAYEEESGAEPDEPWTSTRYTATDHHHVYDRLGLVFSTRNRRHTDPDPVLLRIFFTAPRVFDNTEAPVVQPKQRGSCRVRINGVVVDPARELRPAGVTFQTAQFPLFGTVFAPASSAMRIDRLYTVDGARHITLFLDGPQTGRASYAEIR